MVFRTSIFILLAAVCAASCTKVQDAVRDDGLIVFTVNPSFDASVDTKASTVTAAELGSINVTATKGTPGSSETAVFSSALFTRDSGGDYYGGKWWPSTDQGYHFYACNGGVTQSFGSNACTVVASTDTDVVCAYLPTVMWRQKAALTFNHIFAQVGTVSVSAPSPYTISAVSASITPKVSGTYDLRVGAGSTDGTGWSSTVSGSVTPLSLSSSNYLYLVPGTYPVTFTYTLTVGDYTDTFTKDAEVSFVAGKVNNITATVPQGNAQSIVISTSLTPWTDNNIAVTGP